MSARYAIGPVLVGLGRETHLGNETGRTYCGRWWTSDERENRALGITCARCRAAYAAGRHPKRAY